MLTPSGNPGEAGFAELASLVPGILDERIEEFQNAFTWWRRPDLVSLVAVQGHAVGAGFQLALACDVCVVSPAAAFSMRETSLGLVPDLGGTSPLVAAVGYARALEICLTGRWIGAEEAVTLGLALECVSEVDLANRSRGLLEAMISAPAQAVVETKQLLLDAVRRSPADQRAAERAAQGRRLRELVGMTEQPREQAWGSQG
jgi:enoyl-CoA hydratase/carnithine racemase